MIKFDHKQERSIASAATLVILVWMVGFIILGVRFTIWAWGWQP